MNKIEITNLNLHYGSFHALMNDRALIEAAFACGMDK